MIPLICKHCEKDFGYSFENWELHMQMAHDETPTMQCNNCNAVLIGLTEFDRHQEYEHGKMMSSITLGLKLCSRKQTEVYNQ